MHSSLCHHVVLNLSSAAVLLGTTEGELYAHFKNNPPSRMSLAEIDNLNKERLKSGACDSLWFNSELAQKDPLLVYTVDDLCHILFNVLGNIPALPAIVDDFKAYTQLTKNVNLGTILEALRMINSKYAESTGELYGLLDKLSQQEFFKLA